MRFTINKALVTAVAALSIWGSATAAVDQIDGAGATFPYPVYSKWAQAYKNKTGVQLNYQAIGSGGGIKQIEAKTVDFGASDAPLKKEELDKNGLMQFPMVMGGVVPVVNIKGMKAGELKLDGKTLAEIYAGKIKKWNAPAIKKLNPNANLPDQQITVVHRSDGSGTTWIFTSYLTKVSDVWANGPGHAKAVSWPTGVGGKGNQGVASYVDRIKNSIGYVEYAYALQNKMAYVQLKNKAGNFVEPTASNFQAAASNADWQNAPGFYEVLTDQPGDKSWPITGASFILMYKQPKNPQVAQAVLKFFDWSYANGDQMANELDYVPMPDNVVKLVQQKWQDQIQGNNGQAIWPPQQQQ
ncbi:phosphate ABC transporter substrate-binding protein PstS [Salinisphaera sp. Q1T1-3]|uniref:phosphate ABC transporter substrate-binding protein PstS n=1 Tax=Salinisphaera sp. Q1T1-3 TaxID=2321229 RepID=UPI000E7278A9|nr:phosphate ABC transporter substrate-binding protein PstS [Salinisphaera sp. Q1T1-3]RJS95046.1 phosphate ABC transporter substrate-binding protein PstS [Salinisphaera sp. Q1T1-3]